MVKVKPKLWIISELFYPEQTSTGYFLTEIATGLADDMDVHVVCGQPTYSEHGARAPRSQCWRGMSIVRLPATSFRKDRLILRAINTITLSMSLLFYLSWSVRSGEKVLLVTNPPMFTPIMAVMSKIKKLQSFLLVHDVYPEILSAVKITNKSSLIYKFIFNVMNFAFSKFEKIIVLGKDMQRIVIQKTGFEKNRVIVITNWGDHDEIRPVSPKENMFAASNGLKFKTVIQFSGNIGLTHDVESVLYAALHTEGRKNIHYLIAGSGGKAKYVKKHLLASMATNVLFLDRQPREVLGAMLSSASAVVIPFNSEMLGLSVPSRMYNVMAAGTPIIAMADEESELACTVSDHAAGWVIKPGDSAALISTILFISTPEGKKEARRRGMNGRRAVCSNYSLSDVIKEYKKVLLGGGCES
jgi:colanic acid biosynthesis glycosyl transferase WcaI